MRVVHGFHDLGLTLQSPAVTIGNFDGVHRGHQAVMEAALRAARARSAPAVVCTFEPHTAHVLRPDAAPPLLQTFHQRARAIGDLGIDLLVVIPFDREVAGTGHRDFVDRFLRGELGVGSLHVSKGFSFGHDKAGSTAYLERRSQECGFAVERVAPVFVDGLPISSTRVRTAVAAGDVADAARLIGRPFALEGPVVIGAGRGRDLTIPTANVLPLNGCLPARGVYATRTRCDGDRLRPSVTNVGTRPTFEPGATEIVVETHVLEPVGSLYGETLEVEFVERLRDEQAFADAEALSRQIRQDVARAVEILRAAPEVPGRGPLAP